MGRPKILVIDDEQAIVSVISDVLTEEGMEVLGVTDAERGLRAFYEFQPDLVVLDILMPGCDGWELCRRLRQISTLPILMLTACTGGPDLVRGLNLGADDYVTKPFSLEVLRARIEALLRRANIERAPKHKYQAGDVSIDVLSREVTVGGRSVALTPKEFDLLACLIRNAGRTVSRQELLRQVWGPDFHSEAQYLSLYIWYLRNRIEDNPRKPRRIITWRGVGYRFVPVNTGTA
ncbi:MAG TPA: response regulator transcription factor [Anaerolineae bacterium]|nr:response regulator transcription factor [Anaerolineae bacterium]HOQ99608.1 response regulator transcription factor [Anaerolineae bacterium]HPL28096.1 response regulator transcription factor [Anaerolineae bacterium]